MLNIFRTIADKKVARRILAAAFLLLLVVEFGSHGLIYAHSPSSQESAAMQSSERGHEDPCRTMICSDGRRRDQQTAKFSHDASQHNTLFDRLAGMRNLSGIERDQPISFEDANAIFRPPLPPFHPPKAS